MTELASESYTARGLESCRAGCLCVLLPGERQYTRRQRGTTRTGALDGAALGQGARGPPGTGSDAATSFGRTSPK
jgi:hypothetical protein